MQAANDFLGKFDSRIVATLGCFDRVIFKGYLPFSDDRHLNFFVDGVLRIRRKDFLPFVEKKSQALVDHAKRMAAAAGVAYLPLKGYHVKEAIIRDVLEQRQHAEGLVAVLCCQEVCRTVKLLHGHGIGPSV